MLGVPLTVQNLDDWGRPFARRLRAIVHVVMRSQVRHRKSGTICKHLEPLPTKLDRLARGYHIQRSLARTVVHAFDVVPHGCRIKAFRDGALTRADIDDARRTIRFFEERREGFEHQQRAGSVGLKHSDICCASG